MALRSWVGTGSPTVVLRPPARRLAHLCLGLWLEPGPAQTPEEKEPWIWDPGSGNHAGSAPSLPVWPGRCVGSLRGSVLIHKVGVVVRGLVAGTLGLSANVWGMNEGKVRQGAEVGGGRQTHGRLWAWDGQ